MGDGLADGEAEAEAEALAEAAALGDAEGDADASVPRRVRDAVTLLRDVERHALLGGGRRLLRRVAGQLGAGGVRRGSSRRRPTLGEAEALAEADVLAVGVALAFGVTCRVALAASASWRLPKHSSCVPSGSTRQTSVGCGSTTRVVEAGLGRRLILRAAVVRPVGADVRQNCSFCRSSIVPFARPGIWTSIVLPDRKISGSPTPNASTRLRMLPSACSITSRGRAVGGREDHRDPALEVETRASASGRPSRTPRGRRRPGPRRR